MTTTTNVGLTLPAYNSLNWNTPLNANFTTIDSCLGATQPITVTSTDVTLTTSDVAHMRIYLTGAMSASVSVMIPSGIGGMWVISNATTDVSISTPCYVTVKTNYGGSTGVIAPRGMNILVFSDGQNVSFASGYVAATTPAGMIMPYGANSVPGGWFACNGAEVSRSTYSTLFAAIGTTWGVGNGSSTYNLPDLRGYFLRGVGTNGDGTASGAFATKQVDAFGSHTHTASVGDPGHLHSIPDLWEYASPGAGGPLTGNGLLPATGVTTGGAATGVTVSNSYSGDTETRPKNIAVLYCIKY